MAKNKIKEEPSEVVELDLEEVRDEKAEESIDFNTFSNINALKWMIISRVKHLIEIGKIKNENTLTEWNQILEKI